MFKHLVVGTAVLAAALAIVPTAAQAQDFRHDRDFRFDRNYRYEHQREEAREWREHLRRERERRIFEHRFDRY